MDINNLDVTRCPHLSSAHLQSSEYPVLAFARLQATACLPALQKEIQRLTKQEWIHHVNQQDYRGEWDVLPLRCERRHRDAHPVLQAFAIETGELWQDLPVLDSCPTIKSILRNLSCPLKAVRLMCLRAGAEIRPHRDQGLSMEYGEVRLHLPIFTSDSVSFVVDGCSVPMKAGELWYINADLEHAVRNDGLQDRIHLVIDCAVNEWLKDRITSACQWTSQKHGECA